MNWQKYFCLLRDNLLITDKENDLKNGSNMQGEKRDRNKDTFFI